MSFPLSARPLRAGLLVGTLALLGPLAATAQPTVTSLAPPRNGFVARGGSLSVTFSSALEARTLRALRVFSAQAGGQKSGTATLNGRTLTFDPATDFTAGETLWATLDTAARDSLRRPLARPQVWQFTAAATGGTGSFSGGSTLSLPTTPIALLAGDIDGDGDQDLLGVGSRGRLSIRLNDGTGSFYSIADLNLTYTDGAVALADMDGDGDLDLVSTGVSSAGGHYSVYRNDGRGSFALFSSASLGGTPNGAIALADLDGDGDLDLVTPSGSTSVQIYLNSGTGTLSYSTALTYTSQPNHLTLGDVDNDGDVDILSVSFDVRNSVAVRLNNGRGAFTTGPNAAVDTGPQRVRLADLDQDGDLDLLTLNAGTATTPDYSVSVRLNSGSGSFGGGSTLALSQYPRDMTVADVEGDGDLDVLLTNEYANEVAIQRNNGSGGFAPGNSAAVGPRPGLLIMPDLDGDGDVDLVTALSPDGDVTVLRNGGNPPAAYAVTAVTPARNAVAVAAQAPVTATFSTPMSGAPATLGAVRAFGSQGRGRLAATVSATGNSLRLTPTAAWLPGERVQVSVSKQARSSTGLPLAQPYVWQFTAAARGGTGQFGGGSDQVFALPYNSPAGLRLADVDGDGDLDIVTCFALTDLGSRPQIPVSVMTNNGAGTFSAPRPLLGASVNSWGFELADLDGDGDLDFIGNTGTASPVWLNNGTGTFAPGGSIAHYVGAARPAVGDVDGDGDLDCTVGGARLNDGQGNFYGSARPIGQYIRGSAMTDVDGDGDLDIVGANDATNSTFVLRNDGSGNFSLGQQNIQGSADDVLVGDVDGDGDPDVVPPGNLVWFNNGQGAFTQGSAFTSLTWAQALGDVDGDGDLDLIGRSGSNNFQVALNNGAGRFSAGPPVSSLTGIPTLYSALGDLDNDGDLDLVAVAHSDNGGNGGMGSWHVRLNANGVTGTTAPRPAASVQVWPNPAPAGTAWQLQTGSAGGTLTLRNALGQVVRVAAFAGRRTSLPTAGLPAGLYQLLVQQPGYRPNVQTLVVE